MSTNMTEFSELCEDDKIALLKKGCTEIICLLTVVTFDFEGEFWTVPIDDENAAQVSLDVLKWGKWNLYDLHRQFMFNVYQEYNSDMNIIDLLTAILLFNPNQSNLIHKDMIK
ncbi:unnamed protein product [Oppiella nova]|uniref:NR LBD domain-containing protein n=1 Tax=Oppiella nova TaxID=334625 RepID=A0A7R9QER8_9ACAR|nr:unnamed protein product [Oppiella nova]CAG2163563.1 unnamed protein product [Oppiella nova]